MYKQGHILLESSREFHEIVYKYKTSKAVSLRFRIDAIAGIHSIVFKYIYLVKRKEARSFNFTFRYEDDVLSLINYVDRIYPIEPDITGTTYIFRSASYLDLHLEVD